MRFQQGLKGKIERHYTLILESEGQRFGAEVRYLCDFIEKTPVLRFAMETVERSEPEFDPALWLKNAVRAGEVGVTWPDTSAQRLKGCWHTVRKWQVHDAWQAAAHLYYFGNRGEVSERLRRAAAEFVAPICDFLLERLGEASDVLYLLERYCRRTAWFTARDLYERYDVDHAIGEEVYDSDLRQFLFDQGIDYPMPKPRTASGEADLVANLEIGDDPLVCEVKLFDGERYGRSYIAKGLRQAISYANDFGKSVAYLIVFNLTEKFLRFPTDGLPSELPPRIDEGGVTVFLIEVRALPQVSASRRGRGEVFEISRQQLLTEAESAD